MLSTSATTGASSTMTFSSNATAWTTLEAMHGEWRNTGLVTSDPAPEETPQEREAREERDRVRREAREARERERAAQQAQIRADRAAAVETAVATLLSFLNDDQRASYLANREFEVTGSRGGRYRISPGSNGNVEHLDSNGQVTARLCAHPNLWDGRGQLPDPDVALGQMFALTTDEPGFVAVANVHAGRRPTFVEPEQVAATIEDAASAVAEFAEAAEPAFAAIAEAAAEVADHVAGIAHAGRGARQPAYTRIALDPVGARGSAMISPVVPVRGGHARDRRMPQFVRAYSAHRR